MTDNRAALDLSTKVARELALKNHIPAESWDWENRVAYNPRVACELCEQDWPCETRINLLSTEYVNPLAEVPVEVLRELIKLYDAVDNNDMFEFDEVMKPVIQPYLNKLKILGKNYG